MNNLQNEFIGSTSAVRICNEYELKTLKEFLGIKNMFDKSGNIAAQITARKYPIVFYRDVVGYYIDQAEEQEVKDMKYKVVSFQEMFPPVVEQRSLFGGENAPGLRQPDEDLIQPEPLDPIEDPMSDSIIDTEPKVVNELSLAETLNQLQVGSIVPATITGNILEFKDSVIHAINKYKGIVVTKDNFKEVTVTRADLNNKKKEITNNRKNIKNEALKNVNEVYDAMTDIIKAIENVVDPLDKDIKSFEELEKKELEKKLMESTINPVLEILIKNNQLDSEMAEKFTFNKAWTNASAWTKTGNLTKKTESEINAELERLTNLYQQKQNDIETIKSTVSQLAIARNVEGSLNADTYIELYKKGAAMPQVQERINQDLEMIKKVAEQHAQKEVEKVQKIQSEQHSSQQAQQQENIQNVSNSQENQDEMINLIDDKTGELLAKGNDRGLSVKIIQTPEKYQGKIYEYTYSFRGSFGAIKTFSNILKLISMMFKDFKYEKK